MRDARVCWTRKIEIGGKKRLVRIAKYFRIVFDDFFVYIHLYSSHHPKYRLSLGAVTFSARKIAVFFW